MYKVKKYLKNFFWKLIIVVLFDYFYISLYEGMRKENNYDINIDFQQFIVGMSIGIIQFEGCSEVIIGYF